MRTAEFLLRDFVVDQVAKNTDESDADMATPLKRRRIRRFKAHTEHASQHTLSMTEPDTGGEEQEGGWKQGEDVWGTMGQKWECMLCDSRTWMSPHGARYMLRTISLPSKSKLKPSIKLVFWVVYCGGRDKQKDIGDTG